MSEPLDLAYFQQQFHELHDVIENYIISNRTDLGVLAEVSQYFLVNAALQLGLPKEELLKNISEFYSKQGDSNSETSCQNCQCHDH